MTEIVTNENAFNDNELSDLFDAAELAGKAMGLEPISPKTSQGSHGIFSSVEELRLV